MGDAIGEDLTRLRSVLSNLGVDVAVPMTRLASVSNLVFKAGNGDATVVVRAPTALYGDGRTGESAQTSNRPGGGTYK